MTPAQERPQLALPTQFAEQPGWKPAAPQDYNLKADWWRLFQDETLNILESRVISANQNVAQAVASYDQARALVSQQRASMLPSITANASASPSASFSGGNTNRYSPSIGVSWEPDLFGGLRAGLSQNKQLAAASAGDLANALLAAQGEVALNYVQLRALDAQRDIQHDAVTAYQRALTITTNRYNQGIVAKLDVVQAEAQWQSARATAADLERQRAILVHAIAVLVGENPSLFILSQSPWAPHVPDVPAVLPSTLLERRPDVAAQERRVYAANAGVGVARSAFFPTLNLTANANSAASAVSGLFKSATSFWALGANLAETIFDFGGRNAKLNSARANYRQTVAKYKATVLTAFQQTEDELVAARIYAEEEQERRAASVASDRAEAITFNQYKAGIVGYANVITAQTTALSNRQAAIIAVSNRQQAAVSLIQAIGGGWGG